MFLQPPRNPETTMTSGTLCERAGVTRGVLRVYEREGLLGRPPRTPAGYRIYPPNTLERLQAIRQLKEVGFTLREIALLLSESDHGGIGVSELQRRAREQVVVIDERIARLQVVREYAAAVAAGDVSLLDDPECGFLMRFLNAAVGKPSATTVPSDCASGARRAAPAVKA